MLSPYPMRPQAKVEIVKQSRDRWKSDAATFAVALNTVSFVMLHGDRHQQIKAANDARGILKDRGYPVRPTQTMRFDVTVRTANGFQHWTALGRSSIDVLLDTLTHFDERAVTVRVRREVRS